MDLSFQEKSILGSLVVTIVLFGYYFLIVFKVFTSGSSTDALTLPLTLIGVVVAIVVIEIVYHVLLALRSRADEEDERDRLIGAKATRISYFVLVAGCITTVGHSMMSVFFEQSFPPQPVPAPIVAANFIIFSFILAEIVGFAMQLYYYRRGV